MENTSCHYLEYHQNYATQSHLCMYLANAHTHTLPFFFLFFYPWTLSLVFVLTRWTRVCGPSFFFFYCFFFFGFIGPVLSSTSTTAITVAKRRRGKELHWRQHWAPLAACQIPFFFFVRERCSEGKKKKEKHKHAHTQNFGFIDCS